MRYFKCPSLLPMGNFIKPDMLSMIRVPLKLLLSRFLKASNKEEYVSVQGT
jgi:hypothetical protein